MWECGGRHLGLNYGSDRPKASGGGAGGRVVLLLRALRFHPRRMVHKKKVSDLSSSFWLWSSSKICIIPLAGAQAAFSGKLRSSGKKELQSRGMLRPWWLMKKERKFNKFRIWWKHISILRHRKYVNYICCSKLIHMIQNFKHIFSCLKPLWNYWNETVQCWSE